MGQLKSKVPPEPVKFITDDIEKLDISENEKDLMLSKVFFRKCLLRHNLNKHLIEKGISIPEGEFVDSFDNLLIAIRYLNLSSRQNKV